MAKLTTYVHFRISSVGREAAPFVAGTARPQQQMEMLRHKNIPDDPQSQFLSEFAPSSHPMVPETLRTVKAGSPLGALGQKVQVVVAMVMVKLGQARTICLQGRLHRDKKRHDVGATGGVQQDISTLLKPDIITLPRHHFAAT